MDRSILNQLQSVLGTNRVKHGVVLAPYTTFKMGGKAQYYFEAETKEDIVKALSITHKLNIPCIILGGVTNVIVSEKGIKGLVVRNRFNNKETIADTDTSVLLLVSSGYPMGVLVKETVEKGLSGLEMHLGLPGTVGGAVYMNSKWINPRAYVGDVVHSAEIVDKTGNVKTVDHNYFDFRYGYSKLQQTKEILLTVTFYLKKDNPKKVIQRANKALEYRKKTQPFGVASSGCFFKNIDGQSAGAIIDKLGLKGLTVGGLTVSNIHGNFIVNDGKGTDEDFRKIINKIKSMAKEKFKIELQEEIVFLH